MTLQFYYLGINEDDAKLSYEVAHRLILWYEQAIGSSDGRCVQRAGT